MESDFAPRGQCLKTKGVNMLNATDRSVVNRVGDLRRRLCGGGKTGSKCYGTFFLKA